MSKTAIQPGCSMAKPVETQEACDAYAAMAEAVNAHNRAASVGDTLWCIEEQENCYAVVEGSAMPEPGAPEASLEEQVAALQDAQTDTDSLLVDQEYRLTLLELGLDDTDNA